MPIRDVNGHVLRQGVALNSDQAAIPEHPQQETCSRDQGCAEDLK